MVNFVRDHALQNVWCEPTQDHQYHITPARITRAGGALKTTRVLWENLALPSSNDPLDRSFYHVYQVGQLPASIFKLQLVKGMWYNSTNLMQDQDIVIDALTIYGTRVPPIDVWLLINHDNNFLLALRHNRNIDHGLNNFIDSDGITRTVTVNLDNTDIVFRSYASTRIRHADWRASVPVPDQPVRVVTAKIMSSGDFSVYLSQVNAIKAAYAGFGHGVTFKDGYHTPDILTYNTSLNGKRLSFIYEEVVKRVVIEPFLNLPTFVSQLDLNQPKHVLLMRYNDSIIDYFDDIDFYICYGTPTDYKGVMLNKSNVNAVRQLTHTAYSLNSDLILRQLSNMDATDLTKVFIKAVIREGGMVRGLVNEFSRVNELYKLSYDQQLQAMTGVTASMPEWNAINLEQSDYTNLMGQTFNGVTQQLAANTYGYNALVSAFSNPAVTVLGTGSSKYIVTPLSCRVERLATGDGLCSIYCYDVNGVLLGILNRTGISDTMNVGSTYPTAVRAEVFPMQSSYTTDGTFYDQDVTTTDLKQYGFRAYVCIFFGGVPDEQWVDVTDSVYYTYTEDSTGVPTINWNWSLLSAGNLFPAIKINNTLLNTAIDNYDVSTYPGYIIVTPQHTAEWFNVMLQKQQTIPPAVIDVFLNNVPLVQDIDYVVKWPKIAIVKKPNVSVNDINVVVRTYGFGNPQTNKPFPIREVGFVTDGKLSVDNEYDIRNDRAIHIVSNGRYYQTDEVTFSEGSANTLITDGKPYCVKDYMAPIELYTTLKTIPEKLESLGIDQRVENYLTQRLTVVTPVNPSILNDRWEIVSPFCSAILHAMVDGFLAGEELDGSYTSAQVDVWISPFKFLLELDPCVVGVDDRYVVALAHQYNNTMEISAKQYRLLEYLIKTYLSDKVDLTPLVTIGL